MRVGMLKASGVWGLLVIGLLGASPISAWQEEEGDFNAWPAPEALKDDWPWWRGPSFDGRSPSLEAPLKWSAEENVIWSVDVPGRGNASPTVVGDAVYLPSCDETTGAQAVYCFDRATGRQRWATEVHASGAMRRNERSTGASATISCDGERLYVNFPTTGAVFTTALSLDGKIVWQRMVDDYKMHQGYGSSPALYRDLVLVVADHKGGGKLVALRKTDGDVLWERERPEMASYPTPVVYRLYGRDQLILIGCDKVSSFDPASGETLWDAPHSTTECVTTTVTDGKHVYSSGGFPRNHIAAVKADGSGALAWENGDRAYVPSMLLRDGYLYVVLDAGVAKCFRADTGEEMWKHRLRGEFSSSPVLVGNLIYVTSEVGETFIYEATPEGYREVGRNKLGSECFATPAICGGKIYFRVALEVEGKRQERLICVGAQ
ncbi:MAG: PQQ-binding-like beta-propeller repeat protein [Planctomycetota bacterium]|jgi:outer membrane protein assembly factor BamB